MAIPYPIPQSVQDVFWSRVQRTDHCWLWLKGVNEKGYGQFYKWDQNIFTHRLSWVITHGPIPEGLQVLHKCDNPPCVNPDHLFLGTNLDNVRDAQSKGRFCPPHGRGSDQPNSRLTESQVRQIRARYADGETQHALAGNFLVHRSQIQRIVRRQQWAHVTDTPQEPT